MAVTTTITPRIQPLASNDKRLPIGYWAQEGSSAGDVSGGINSLRISFSTPTPQYLISVENVNPNLRGATVDRLCNLIIQYQDIMIGDLFWTLTLVAFNTFGAPGSDARFFNPLIANPTADSFTVRADVTNTNGETIKLNAWGYIWEIGARNLPGGPIRPTQF